MFLLRAWLGEVLQIGFNPCMKRILKMPRNLLMLNSDLKIQIELAQ
jgi:hypothetical protein